MAIYYTNARQKTLAFSKSLVDILRSIWPLRIVLLQLPT